jgi:hypothetical protein
LGSFLLAVIRVFFGLIIFIIGMAITIAPLALLGVYFGIAPGNDVYLGIRDSIPMEWITEIVPVWLAISASVVMLIPGIIIVLLGISVLIKKSIIDARFGLVALGVWLLSIGLCAFQIPRVVANFKTEATHTVEQTLAFTPGTMVLKSVENDNNDGIFDEVRLQLDGTDAAEPILLQKFEARGKNKADALKSAESIQYSYKIEDSTITFERSIKLNELEKFRVQNLRLNLEMPYDRPFVMDKSIIPIIENTIHRNGYKTRDINSRNHWVFNENGLLCLTCNDAGKTTSADSLSRVKFEGAYFMKK